MALNSSETVPTIAFDPTVSGSFNWSTSVSLYDSQGNEHTMTQYFVKEASNEWSMHVLIDGRNPGDPASTDPYQASLSFDTSGRLQASASSDFTVNADGTITLADWVPATITDATTDPVTWGDNGAAASTSG